MSPVSVTCPVGNHFGLLRASQDVVVDTCVGHGLGLRHGLFNRERAARLSGGESFLARRYVTSQGAGLRTALREQPYAMLSIADDGSIPLLGRLWTVRGTK